MVLFIVGSVELSCFQVTIGRADVERQPFAIARHRGVLRQRSLADSGLLRGSVLDCRHHRSAHGCQELAKGGNVFQRADRPVARNDRQQVEPEHRVEPRDPAVEITVPKPRETPRKHQVAQECDPLRLKMNDEVAVAMRRASIVRAQRAARKRDADTIRESRGGGLQCDRVVVRAVDALEKPDLVVAFRADQLLDVGAEE